MKNSFFLLFLISFITFNRAIAQNVVHRLPDDFEELKLEKGVSILKDVSQKCTIEDLIAGNANCRLNLTKNITPSTGFAKHAGWLSFQINAGNQQEVLLQLDNALLHDLNVYLVENKKIIQKFENFSPAIPIAKRPFPRNDYVFRFSVENNKKYSFYINYKVVYTAYPVNLTLWTEKSLQSHTQNENHWHGIFYGILLLILIIGFLAGLLLKLRLFLLFGLNVLAVIVFFLYTDGVLFEYIPYQYFTNRIYDLILILFYIGFIVHIFFLRGFTQIHLSKKTNVQFYYKIILSYIIFIFTFTLFVPFLNKFLPYTFFLCLAWFNISMFFLIICMYILNIKKSYLQSSFTKTYLKICLIGAISYGITFMGKTSIINLKIDYGFQYCTLLVIFCLLIGMIYEIGGYFGSIRGKAFIPEKNIEILDYNDKKSTHFEEKNTQFQALTKRENEILRAFANGFTHSEIADAMFISPHTAKTHIKTIYRKLGINSKVEAVRYVIDNEI